ncbi:MAG: GIY-YIG nuclease family protein [Bacteroidota bacterium]
MQQLILTKTVQNRRIHVYVLRSVADGDRYVGLSTDVPHRVEEHNAGKVKSTKARVPFVLVYQEPFDTLIEARAREKYFKTAAGRRWLDKRGF